jgi:heptosyltransferase I
MKILIVKTSSFGDIIQCFPVLNYLHQISPKVQIDWVVEDHLANVVQSHPLVHKAISKKWSEIRKEKYDYLFDLQGNCKSGWITFIARAEYKIGFAYSNVREWPNILATRIRFSVPKGINIRLQYLSILEQFFQKKADLPTSQPKKSSSDKYVMVCPGSKWVNKQLKEETLRSFLQSLYDQYQMRFLFVWGTEEEKKYCEKMELPESVILPKRLEILEWQNLMEKMDLVIAVDSSALHLCGTTNTSSFSIFGPTKAEVFKPLGEHHFAFQGTCPYHRTFLKQCPILRTCSSGACIRDIQFEELEKAFSTWWLAEKTERLPSSNLDRNLLSRLYTNPRK